MKHAKFALIGLVVALGVGGCTKSSQPAASGGGGTSGSAPQAAAGAMNDTAKGETVDYKNMTDEQWRAKLTPEQYRILREKGTERAFTGKYWNTKSKGVYKCAGCGEVLFVSDSKFDSGCGWPSFSAPADGKLGGPDGAKVAEHRDTTYGMVRTEVTCAKCGGHLGHVFADAPDQPTGLRYCINSESIQLDENAKADAEKKDDKKEEKK